MTNVLKFMLLTGKYLPEENIQYIEDEYYFEHLNSDNQSVYKENSNGYWEISEFNETGDCTYFENSNNYVYRENSDGHWERLYNGKIISSGNNND